MDEILGTVGPFELVRILAKGGMGEVYLAKDPSCGRLIALKKIRADMVKHKTMHERFLREAKIAAQLTHPSIISIYTISDDKQSAYYTMPYIEGETLKEILTATRQQTKKGETLHPIGGSVPSLMRIFLDLCRAIAYVHSKNVLHRDLKPDNIIIGKYGEVVILDWGLADYVGQDEAEALLVLGHSHAELTHPGKIPGTLAYMAPERAHGEKSSFLTDIYALGVILYQMLTLRLPFQRTTLAEYRKYMAREELQDPVEVSPYRDIPLQLAAIAKKCLSAKKEERYQSVAELINELQSYSEGRPEWIPAAELKIREKKDWEFQENILLAKHLAITREPDVMEWVNLMISKASFPGNTRIETRIRLGGEGKGIGVLFCIPENSERIGLADGYSLWVSSDNDPSTKLFRSGVEVMHIPDVGLKPNTWHTLSIEKLDNHVRFFLDGRLQLHYLSHRPIVGTHIGLLFRDDDFQMEALKIFVGSLSVQVNCLAVPDAFLANRLYTKALSEYRRIAYCFPGRAEGREALFRAGITLLEEALAEKKKTRQIQLFSLALEEFGKLRNTPGAPLEYLGKSLVYKAWHELEDEIKCLELALRKYPKHPLLAILIEEVTFRLHESSAQNRTSGYHFALLALRHLPQIFTTPDGMMLLESLKKHLEPLAFIDERSKDEDPLLHLSIQLAFWLVKPITLFEILENSPTPELSKNALFALLNLGCTAWVKEALPAGSALESVIVIDKQPTKTLEAVFTRRQLDPQLIRYLCEHLIDKQKSALLLPYLDKLAKVSIYDDIVLTVFLFEKKWKKAETIFKKYPKSALKQVSSPLFYLYGCYLGATKGKKAAYTHFAAIDDLSYLPTSALLAAFLSKKINFKKGWIERAFFWEKIQLLRQLILFSHCTGARDKKSWQKQLNRELRHASKTYAD